MKAAQLLTHFSRISEAPDAIPRLRRFILELAVRGKLVEQNPRDEPASELRKRIQAEKARLLKIGEIKKLEAFEPVEVHEIPFAIPSGWEVMRMGWLARKLGAGSTPLGGKSIYQSEGVPFLRSQNIHDDGLRLEDVALISRSIHERMSGTHVQHDDILLNITGASIGRCALVPANFIEGNVSQHVAIIRLFLSNIRQFIHLSLTSPLFQKVIDDVQVGVSREGLSMQRLRLFPMLLPPFAEQHRIVAKVDELMALCDRLEAAQGERESRRDRLAAASLNRLNQPTDDPSAFQDHARFYFNHLPRLTTRPEHIKQLRQTILNLAVRGKLVEQDPNDEQASELLKRIEAEKARFAKNGTLRKELPLPPVAEYAAPFAIPRNWIWARIGTCSLLIEYGTSVKSYNAEKGVPVVKMGDIQGSQIILGGQKKVPRQIEDLPQLFLKRFDLLYNRTNSAELVGKTGIYLGEDDAYTFASYLIRIRFINDMMSPVYSNLAMNAPYFRETQILPALQQQCGQANVNGTKLRNMVIPLPPLAEQHRIVAKVNEMIALCDRLEAQLTITQTETRSFLESVLQELAGETRLKNYAAV
jgi:type I restriction enzyme, S subunit